jgi:hypothetical protein
VRFALWRKSNLVYGEVCTIRLLRESQCDNSHELKSRAGPQLPETVEEEMKKSVVESLGSRFEVERFFIAEDGAEIILRITTNGYSLQNHGEFVKGLKSLAAHLRMKAEWLFERHGLQGRVKGQFSFGPSLIRLQLESSGTRDTLSKIFQQPLTILLIGTVLGSVLIPYLNDRANRAKLRHEERVKIALNIVEQSHETDRRLSSLMNYLVLFRKDHNDRSV